ncbi:LacI family DNA-binding transcriptional regulator [Halobacillus shinanisalinarum]|uniref:LacI family DNA-binding transcriptional regulator n=1 Tax=Halobacillus shinanisalinarum TaxID=2932258 RepID=A0ABY4GVD5_9BACI|nr:LacI family DNA-binding transcriptional regulator [Halobacillus shinanisalinarum]UOQ91989.1 LacI family DNA-binding transcriptional regulator [Halobacillus shinanisalinarum]
MSQKKARVTLKQVAEHAGVSRATASLIVRNSPSISEPTREKVLASMEELGYVYDRVAANLRGQSSTTVGLIITDIANPFFNELLVGVHNRLEEDGYTVILGTTFDMENKQQKLISTMMEHRVGGIILCPVSDSSSINVEELQRWNLPIVTAVREIEGLACDYVGINYAEGAQMAVEHLINKGHQRIAFVGGNSESSAWQNRKKGYMLAHKKAEIEVDESLIVESSAERSGGVESIERVLEESDPPSAVFCFNDLVAFGVIEGLRRAGYQPGKDVAVVGFDNVEESATLSYPSLTTISSHAKVIGSKAADLLHQRINNNEVEQQRIILHPDLVIRESS